MKRRKKSTKKTWGYFLHDKDDATSANAAATAVLDRLAASNLGVHGKGVVAVTLISRVDVAGCILGADNVDGGSTHGTAAALITAAVLDDKALPGVLAAEGIDGLAIEHAAAVVLMVGGVLAHTAANGANRSGVAAEVHIEDVTRVIGVVESIRKTVVIN